VTFDKDAELDPQLSGTALAALLARYEQHLTGRELPAKIEKAIKAVLGDLETLIESVSSDGSEDVSSDVPADKLLLEIYWRLHDNWKSETAPALKMIDVTAHAPAWPDVATLFAELSSLDQSAGEDDAIPAEAYEDLLARYEARLGKGKPKVKKAAPKKAAPPIKEPPPDAQILDYSPKSTFSVGQWVRHPKFGVGIVIEAAQHVTLEFGPDRKILSHVAAPPPPIQMKPQRMKPTGDTVALARAAGIEVKKVPGQFDEEK
jgi:hypothetical protein